MGRYIDQALVNKKRMGLSRALGKMFRVFSFGVGQTFYRTLDQ